MPVLPLTATELALVIGELDAHCSEAVVVAVAVLEARDDLLLTLDGDAGRRTLQIAPGGRRARVTTTERRWPKQAFASGPRIDLLESRLRGARVRSFEAVDGERRCTIHFESDGERLALECELFGPRGLWLLCDAAGTILVLSRLPDVKGRSLRPGAAYAPPAPRPTPAAEPAADRPPRFQPPYAPAIDAVFTALDLDEEATGEAREVEHALARARSRMRSRRDGLARSRHGMERAAELRLHADLLLAYGHGLADQADELRAPHPSGDGGEVVIPRNRRLAPHAQAEALYRKARKLDHGRAAADEQLAQAEQSLAAIDEIAARLAADPRTLPAVRAELERHGLLAPRRPKPPDERERRLTKLTAGENFRRFWSVEGALILVGRDDRQNDRLTSRIARGNDLWLHVGRGYAGSHVVVRVDKGRSASLETLLDAATLAIHFSRVRGAELEEVIYTQAKNVRKAKGMAPGKVLAARTKSLRVRMEPERLRRLLSSADPADPRP